MRRLMLVGFLLVVFAGLGLAGESPSAGSVKTRWVIRDLGTLGGEYSRALAINQRGQVVGTSRAATGERHLVMWADGRMTDLGRYRGLLDIPLLNDRGQVAWYTQRDGARVWKDGVATKPALPLVAAMNDRGQMVGAVFITNRRSHAALLENGRVRDLGTLPGHKASSAGAISNSGLVAGTSYQGGERSSRDLWRAFLWQAGKMRDLGVLPGFAPGSTNCTAVAVNDSGQVLGYCATAAGSLRMHGFLWEGGTMRDLGVLEREWIRPDLLNGRGQVVGATTVKGQYVAFFWQNSKMTTLATPGGAVDEAAALNDKGQVVGDSRTKTGALHAFVWENGQMTDLGTLPGDTYSHGVAINDNGQIVGYSVGRGYNAPSHAVLWTLRSGG